MYVSSTGLSFIFVGPMAAGVRVLLAFSLAPGGQEGCSPLFPEKRESCVRINLVGWVSAFLGFAKLFFGHTQTSL